MSDYSDQIRNNVGMMEDLHDNFVQEQERKAIEETEKLLRRQFTNFYHSEQHRVGSSIEGAFQDWLLKRLAELDYRLTELERVKHLPTTKQ